MNDEEYRAIRLCVARAIIEAGGDTPTFDLVMAPLDTLRTNAAASEAALTLLQRESATREREVRAEERERCAKVCEDQMPDVGTHGCATAIRAGVECVPLIFAQEKAWEEGYQAACADDGRHAGIDRSNPYRSGT